MDRKALPTTFAEIARRNRLVALQARTQARLAALTAALADAPPVASRGFGAAGHDFAQVPLQLLGADRSRRLHLAQFG